MPVARASFAERGARRCERAGERTSASAVKREALTFAADSHHAARAHPLQPPQVVPCKVKDRENLANKYKVYDENGGCCEFLLCVLRFAAQLAPQSST